MQVLSDFKIKKDIDIINNAILVEKEVNNEILSRYYVGYLDIPKYNIKRLIKVGETKSVLDSNYVLYYNSFYDIDKNNFNIILLGHNIDVVFRFLHNMNVGDEIILVTHEYCYLFEINGIDVISERDIHVLNKRYNNKTLTLITCMKNNKNRLVLTAKLKKIT